MSNATTTAAGTDDATRDRLRKLQDQFLGLPSVKGFAERCGEDTPVFEAGSPTISQLRQFVYPACEPQIRDYLDKLN